jgi:hypothetical protein
MQGYRQRHLRSKYLHFNRADRYLHFNSMQGYQQCRLRSQADRDLHFNH